MYRPEGGGGGGGGGGGARAPGAAPGTSMHGLKVHTPSSKTIRAID